MNLKQMIAAAKAKLAGLEAKVAEGDADAIKAAEDTLAEIADLEAKLAEAERKDSVLSALKAAAPAAPAKDAPVRTLGEFALKNLDLDAVKAGGRTRTPATFPVKAATDVHVAGEVAVQSQTIVDAQPVTSIRDLFGAETISGNAITFYQMGATEGEIGGPVPENGAKPQFHVPYEPVTVPLSKVAGWFYETDELLSDAAYLRSAIDNRGLFELRRAVESYLMGMLTEATDGVQRVTAPPVQDAVEYANAIMGAIMGVKSETGYDADAIVVTSALYMLLRTTRDGGTTGQYFGGGYFYGPYGNGGVAQQPGIWGLPTIIVPGVDATDLNFTVGAFRQGATVVTKAGEGASIEVHRGDHDDAIHNRVTVVVEERLALAVRVPAAFATTYEG